MSNITFRDFLQELKRHTPYNFCDYSDNSIQRRIDKILKDQNISMDELLNRAKSDGEFCEQLVDDITVNTTELFRNEETWEYLYKNVFPALKQKNKINIWHAGCSTGQEVYSNLILFNEMNLLDKVNVVASDLNNKVLKAARKGEYDLKFNAQYIDVYNDLMHKIKPKGNPFEHYFEVDRENDKIKIRDFMSAIPKFRRHDLVVEEIPFYQKFDIIFCRNVLIYFNPELQLKIVRKFFDKLYDGGVLILGTHEALHGFFKTRFVKHGMVYTKSSTFHLKLK
ncbi:CheR family methyltransferase [Saccharicrinis fermentans]|uniref:Chemotaxis protein methyltransferase n=1 Tax=Saccharicrinis fermentans DSM 9555 = JCM 21142 TaxID=869213 RepID=W7Y1J3_9BACT|nr:protein-glutamate O-methyltransferase CheR [Saccharicrinis fermentans]GAF01837.1 chemotaxis protein methyltransferase [Saccharicrinis fermentans DSM 9555 = JCM 21142]